MRELEQRLEEVEARNNELTRTCESLQLEYSNVKSELDRLREDNARLRNPTSGTRILHSKVWEESKFEGLDPLLFDVSSFLEEGTYGKHKP